MQATVLIADDSIQNLEILQKYLDNAVFEYEIFEANNGEEACEIAENEVVDLILLDWEMPVMKGIDALRRLKAQEKTKTIPIIMVTGRAESEDLKEAFDAGATDYVEKPVREKELQARVESAIKLYKAMSLIKEQNIEIEKQKEMIESQANRELSVKAMESYQKNQMLETIYAELGKVSKMTEGEANKKLQKVLRLIKESLAFEDEWKNFVTHFEKVHPSFFRTLKSQCPQLTTEDLKHCAYIRIYLSNKEIAQLLNITPKSVITHHHRIKKKMALSDELKFADYIRSLGE
ncbi:response regulator [Microscilla marina]|uniref:Two-component hybrid sensor and regulator n=1 Tax=Microscilla marina ATCC 23134 TaxID=313606 RepID=A1ZQ76_MICM2|nr:response regulator [Microscilla marina]EAY27485.1 two-component hybrid sensor and regulator [Microscilla marina ATCC 23134]